jgi:hypothetical protein
MKIVRYIILVLILLNAGVLKADDPGFPGGDPDVPLDGGMIILLIAGVCYGVKKIGRSKEDGTGNS